MYALVDCNNFFVSCERVFRPQLEGKAVVVLSNNDGCVVARSNESKAMGIKMGTPYYQISHLAANGRLEVCSSNHILYKDMSSRVMSILADAVPRIEIYSIDEAFLVLDGIPEEKLAVLCPSLRAKVWKWTGIPVSIGIAPTKTLAKIASHFAKKYRGYNGVCAIDSVERRQKALSIPADAVQAPLFGFNPELREKNDRLSRIMDSVNRKGDSPLLRLASQKPVHYADDSRRGHCSGRYTTSWDELIEIK